MQNHPEQQPDELYMGNTMPEEVGQSSWRTTRLGETPLNIHGETITNSRLKPWFIKRSEVEAAIRTERLTDKPRSSERIGVYESMLAEGKV
jgi:hypothetical protein